MHGHIPQQIGRYRLLQLIGEGGLASVYLARHPTYGQVALKLPRSLPGRKREVERRFQTEAHLLRRLRHPGILRLLDTGAVTLPDGRSQYYLATEYLPGGSLAHLLAEHRHLTEPYVVLLAVQIAEALAYAHDRGVIHRDIKPSNLLLRGPSEIVLADFGIARPLTEATITGGNRILGTLAYMSPEQTLGQRDLVRRGSDIYSFGVVLYEMLSGYQPRSNPNLPDVVVVQMIQQQPLPALARAAPHISSELGSVVQRCIEPDRQRRFETMHGVAAALRQVAAQRGYALPAPARASDVHHSRSGAPWMLIAGIGTALFVIIFVVALLLIAQNLAQAAG